MPGLVVDASVALAWALPDESSAYGEAVLAVVEQDGLHVPELWAREIANGLAVAYLRCFSAISAEPFSGGFSSNGGSCRRCHWVGNPGRCPGSLLR